MDRGSPLGDFLRARRQARDIEDLGLRDSGRRRTPGLRRDEVATLAGVSADYYTRLEQGRERHPSDQVLGALARVLQLDHEATDHLFELVRPRVGRPTTSEWTDRVSPSVQRLMERWDDMVTFVTNRWYDVLAMNHVAAAHLGALEHSDNLLRLTFLNPSAREFYLDWEEQAWSKVAHVRAAAGTEPDDPALLELVEELSRRSEDFRRMWARHDVRAKTNEVLHLNHPIVGEVVLFQESFTVNSAPGQFLFVAQAEPGSRSERALAALAALGDPSSGAGRPNARRAGRPGGSSDLRGSTGPARRPDSAAVSPRMSGRG
ncbi:helix-turn-helix transcriptional regulator [Planotetraspora kaengkrachanensis]|uniref:Transcriptional regulator n=1 Tax=Planotetraspora kaengkrachanensis TaxID=575193 RepID=A0A8J3PQV9_9ACTN|nr:helix-turn-helix transcriptional regulator [Planotetraspora kaengkrachanensis]GIG77809.1 transcriptional regulator [Planotetraspora kaengkrachanensis]